MERLIVKNFGPLIDIDIKLSKINLFIGENGSGKSVLAKLITIILDAIDNANSTTEDIFIKFKDYNINFIEENTSIKYISNDNNIFHLENMKITQELENKIKKVKKEFNKSKYKLNNLEHSDVLKEIVEKIEKIDFDIDSLKDQRAVENFKKIKREFTQIKVNIEKLNTSIIPKIENEMSSLTPKYIPAERNLISLFSKSLSTLISESIPLPKFLLKFASEFEKASNSINELQIMDFKYVNDDSKSRHKVYYDEENYLELEHSSSGVQSTIPLYLTVKYFSTQARTIIIEEPEQNLFPKLQKETIKYIVETINNNLFLMTHSPYVLSTLNILMMAYKAGNLNTKSKEKVTKLVNEKQWINPDYFSAYYLENGIAKNIKGKTGLISDNEIDEINDDIQFEFEEILSIYREYKHDK